MRERHITIGSFGKTRGYWHFRLSLRMLIWNVGEQSRQMKAAIGAFLDYEPPARDWAAYAAKPIETRKGAPDWIRERNEVLNRNPLVRIHNE